VRAAVREPAVLPVGHEPHDRLPLRDCSGSSNSTRPSAVSAFGGL